MWRLNLYFTYDVYDHMYGMTMISMYISCALKHLATSIILIHTALCLRYLSVEFTHESTTHILSSLLYSSQMSKLSSLCKQNWPHFSLYRKKKDTSRMLLHSDTKYRNLFSIHLKKHSSFSSCERLILSHRSLYLSFINLTRNYISYLTYFKPTLLNKFFPNCY